MEWSDLYFLYQRIKQQVREKNISSYAAGSAFFLFLSIIPILIIICSLLPLTPLTEAGLMKIITDLTPDRMDPMAVLLIEQVYDSSSEALTVAVVITLWSAGKGILGLMRGLNVIHGTTEHRGYFRLRLLSSFYMVIILSVTVVTLGLSVFGNWVFTAVLQKVGLSRELPGLFVRFRFLFIWLLLTVAFTLMYTYLPDKKLKLRGEIPGAVFSAVAWNLFSFGFSVYVEYFNSFSAYGRLGTVTIFMLWLYFCNYLFLLGAQINRYNRR